MLFYLCHCRIVLWLRIFLFLGFEEGVVRFDDNGPVNSSLSDSSYQENLQLKFCCREDGMWSDPISLTTNNSFALFRHNDFPCQKVVGNIIRIK